MTVFSHLYVFSYLFLMLGLGTQSRVLKVICLSYCRSYYFHLIFIFCDNLVLRPVHTDYLRDLSSPAFFDYAFPFSNGLNPACRPIYLVLAISNNINMTNRRSDTQASQLPAVPLALVLQICVLSHRLPTFSFCPAMYFQLVGSYVFSAFAVLICLPSCFISFPV